MKGFVSLGGGPGLCIKVFVSLGGGPGVSV